VSKVATKKELSTNNYIAAIMAGTLIIVIVCGLVGKGMVHSLVINTKVIAGQAQAKGNLDTKLNNIPILLNNYQNLGSAKQLIADGLPTSPDFPQIISILQGISAASGVTLSGASPAASDSVSDSATTATPAAAATTTSPTSGTPTPYLFGCTVAGPYAQIVSFFQNLNLSDRPMRVTSAQFAGSTGNVSVNLTIQTYYQAEASVNDTTVPVK
jgi:hypothetical protein